MGYYHTTVGGVVHRAGSVALHLGGVGARRARLAP